MTVIPLTGDVDWIPNCHESGENHLHLSVYVIDCEDGYVLFDSGSGIYDSKVMAAVEEATDSHGPDTVILLHQGLPHKENLSTFEDQWGDIEVISAIPQIEGVDLINDIPDFKQSFGVSEARGTALNDKREFEGRTITCMRPFLTDITVSQWAYDHESQILFTAEAFGHYHTKSHCDRPSNQIPGGIPVENIQAFYEDKFTFLEMLDITKIRGAFKLIREKFNPRYIAPAHGNPVSEADLERYLEDVANSIDTGHREPDHDTS